MHLFKADLHIHTVLSPCGDLDMSPVRVIETAAMRQIDILGVTDHNSTRHGKLIKKLAEKYGIFVLCGAEVTTKEEIHCLTFFDNFESLDAFQSYLDGHLPDIMNKPEVFGYQVVVDENDMITDEVDKLLISALNQGIQEVEAEVHRLGGLFIPAHIDRPSYSLLSQLGFIPSGIKADAMEISRHTTAAKMIQKYPALDAYTLLQNSDAHHPDQIGSSFSMFEMEKRNFAEVSMALKGEMGRRVIRN